MRITDMPLIERISKYMTYSGACTASACGAAQKIDPIVLHTTMTPADIGMWAGIVIGIVGLAIQGTCTILRRIEESRAHKMEMELKRIELRRLADPHSHITIMPRGGKRG